MECCKTEPKHINDLTQGLGKDRHFYCHNCKAHELAGKFYNADDWEKVVNAYWNDFIEINIEKIN